MYTDPTSLGLMTGHVEGNQFCLPRCLQRQQSEVEDLKCVIVVSGDVELKPN
jgi:hypothetical protein